MTPHAQNPARTNDATQRASKTPGRNAATDRAGVPRQRAANAPGGTPRAADTRRTSTQGAPNPTHAAALTGPSYREAPQPSSRRPGDAGTTPHGTATARTEQPHLTPQQLYAARLRTLREQRRTETRKVVTWTTLGWLIPGVGLLRAGSVISGTLLTCLSVLGPLLLLTLLFLGELPTLLTTFTTSPRLLDAAAVVCLAAGVAWVAITVATFFSLRSVRLTLVQNLACLAALLSLVVASIVPVGSAARLMHTNSNVLDAVFDHSSDDPNAPGMLPKRGDPWAGVNRVNVLLIGSDAGHDRTGTRPDSIVVASITPDTGDTVLLSLPRNLVAPRFPSGTTERRVWPNGFSPDVDPHLNAVWAWAEDNKDLFPQQQYPGLTATQHAVEGTLGLNIDYWVIVDLRGFEDVVDALGGLEMTVGQRIAIAKSDDPSPSEWIEPGRQHLTGYQALWFGRSRWGGDDYSRMRRQRCLLGALTAQADPASVARALPALSRAAERHVATSIPASDIPAFVALAERMKGGQMTSLAFTNEVITPGSPDYPTIRRLTRAALRHNPATPTPSASTSPSPTTSSGSSGGTSTRADSTQTRPEALAEVCSA